MDSEKTASKQRPQQQQQHRQQQQIAGELINHFENSANSKPNSQRIMCD